MNRPGRPAWPYRSDSWVNTIGRGEKSQSSFKVPGAAVIGAMLLLLLCASQASAASEAERWSFKPNVYNFGIRAPGLGPSDPKAFVLTNTGEVTLTPTWTGLTWGGEGGPDPEMFKIVGDYCGTLEPGKSCTIEVAFNPSTPGYKQGELTVADVEPSPRGASATAFFEGLGAGRVASLSPSTVAFAPRVEGTGPSSSEIVTVTNSGQLDLTISSVAIVRHLHFDDDQFRLAGGTCGPEVVLSPGGQCTVRVAFDPTAASHFSADLRIEDDAPDSPQYVTLEGTGLKSGSHSTTRRRRGVVLLRHPSRTTTKRSAVFTFKGEEGVAGFECKLDSRRLRPCRSPLRFRHLGIGRHLFVVRTVDANGRLSAGLARFRWKIKARA